MPLSQIPEPLKLTLIQLHLWSQLIKELFLISRQLLQVVIQGPRLFHGVALPCSA